MKLENFRAPHKDKFPADFTWLVIFFSILFYAFFIHSRAYSTNEASRLASIESLVHRGTWQIDESTFGHTVDKIQVDTHFYSSKPPTLSFLGAGVYAILHHGFGLSLVWDECVPHASPAQCRASLEPAETDWAYFTLVLILVCLPAAVILGTLYRIARWRGLPNLIALSFVVVFGLGTAVFPYSTILSNHVPSAAALLLAVAILLKNDTPSPRQLLFAGFWVTLGATIDLSVGIFLLAIFIYVLVRYRRAGIYFVAGALLPGLLAIFLNFQITGTPLPPQLYTRGYGFRGSAFGSAEPIRLLIAPDAIEGDDLASYSDNRLNPERILQHGFNLLVGEYGLFAFYPIVIWFLFGLIAALRAQDKTTRWLAGTIGAAGLVYFLYFSLRPHTFGGYVFGPRWLFNPVPLLALFSLQSQLFYPRKVWRYALFALLGIMSIYSAYPGAIDPWGPVYPPLRLVAASPEPPRVINASLSGYGNFEDINPDIRAGFARNIVPRRWFDARSGFVVPNGPAWWFIHQSTPISPPLAEPFGLRLQTSYELHADLTPQAWQWIETLAKTAALSPDLVPADPNQVMAYTLPVTFALDDDSLSLQGYQINQEADKLILLTAWQIESRTWPTGDRRIFFHLLANDGSIVAQSDTFAANYETLFPGDLFFQMQEIPLAEGAEGEYWLQVGLYDPATGARLQTNEQDRLLLRQIELDE